MRDDRYVRGRGAWVALFTLASLWSINGIVAAVPRPVVGAFMLWLGSHFAKESGIDVRRPPYTTHTPAPPTRRPTLTTPPTRRPHHTTHNASAPLTFRSRRASS